MALTRPERELIKFANLYVPSSILIRSGVYALQWRFSELYAGLDFILYYRARGDDYTSIRLARVQVSYYDILNEREEAAIKAILTLERAIEAAYEA